MSENRPKRLMLMFTIGPVQSFIEAARKTEDLWMGSYILSYLVATAMNKIRGEGVEIIYPAIGKTVSPFDFWRRRDFATPSFPNLFLAIGNGVEVSQDDLVKRAKEAEESVKTEFERMAECVVDEAFKASVPWRGTYVECVFNRQIPDFFDVYWVITEETNEDYGAWYDHTARSLAAIKNCRAFNQTNEFGRKCSLDGTREILHHKKEEVCPTSDDMVAGLRETRAKVLSPRRGALRCIINQADGKTFSRDPVGIQKRIFKQSSEISIYFGGGNGGFQETIAAQV